MANYNLSTRSRIADINQGIRVDRATAALPATTSADIFSVDGGMVLLLGIIGEVTTAIENQLCNTKLRFDPDAVAFGVNDLCADLDVDNDDIGTLYSITGTAATAMQNSTTAGWLIYSLAAPIWLPEGDIVLTTGATNTGSVKWSLWYVPLEDGAYIHAV